MSGGRACMRGEPETWIIGFTEGKATPAADSFRCRTVKASATQFTLGTSTGMKATGVDYVSPALDNRAIGQ
ncbi:hypothetical protein PoMZ_00792 [Pyricularia oryzae]|uniref:Uncharacterized protein n=1 Tax=Pyricularia oryzae TaxID=318829 RepID=A0A4P7N559_PYROR|nr:hypothetical protein PoMZ_00792 [Pyricularia oryzae]